MHEEAIVTKQVNAIVKIAQGTQQAPIAPHSQELM